MTERLARQGFLGERSEEVLHNIPIGIVGLGGGGSHIGQQLAHAGVHNYTLSDRDIVEESNLNRLVGATYEDVFQKTAKVKVIERLIKGLLPEAKVTAIQTDWQFPLASMALRNCSVIFGCVDSLSARAELEQFCRRFLIPYIDIGMDVYKSGEKHIVHGQVCLSLPDDVCMRCMGILRPEGLKQEAQRYGAAGGHPQVVWSNGILASHAVQVFMQLVTAWRGNHMGSGCWEYDGNNNLFSPSKRLLALSGHTCKHYAPDALGDPFWENTRVNDINTLSAES